MLILHLSIDKVRMAGVDQEYPGIDGLTAWYNRNLRIFGNLQRISRAGDRVLVLIGSGHVPIIRHAVDASPEFELIEVADAIAGSRADSPEGPSALSFGSSSARLCSRLDVFIEEGTELQWFTPSSHIITDKHSMMILRPGILPLPQNIGLSRLL